MSATLDSSERQNKNSCWLLPTLLADHISILKWLRSNHLLLNYSMEVDVAVEIQITMVCWDHIQESLLPSKAKSSLLCACHLVNIVNLQHSPDRSTCLGETFRSTYLWIYLSKVWISWPFQTEGWCFHGMENSRLTNLLLWMWWISAEFLLQVCYILYFT